MRYGIQAVSAPDSSHNEETAFRPWYRIHRSTLVVLAIVLAWLVFINVPGDRGPHWPFRFYHGWPYHYFERGGAEYAFWSFAGTAPRFHPEALVLNAVTALCIQALIACPCELWIRRNGRLLRFGTRAMLAATALFAVLMGFVGRDLRDCYRQQQAIHELATLGSVTASHELRKYDWFRSFLGSYTHGIIDGLDLKVTHQIDRLPDFRSLQNIEWLSLEMRNLPENIGWLAELPKLERLCVALTSLGDSGPEKLGDFTELPELWALALLGDEFDDDAVLHISSETRLGWLAIDSSKITAKGLNRLGQLKTLTSLTLHQSVIQTQDCSVLLQFPRLRHLTFLGSNLTAQDEQKMRKLWPDAQVVAGTSHVAPGSMIQKKSLRMWRE